MLITFHERCSRCRKRASHTEELKHLTRFRFRLLLPHLCYVKSFSSLSCAAPERPGQAGCGSADVGYDGPGDDHRKIMLYHLVNTDSVNHAGIPSNLRLSPSGCFRAEQQTRNRKRFAPVRGFPIDPSRNGNGPWGRVQLCLRQPERGSTLPRSRFSRPVRSRSHSRASVARFGSSPVARLPPRPGSITSKPVNCYLSPST